MFDLNLIRVFAKVAELKSVTAAAQALRKPKSSVSRDLARLEEALQVRLLQRTTRRIGLTDEGHVFHRHCLRILGTVEEAEDAVAGTRAVARGHLRVNAPIAFGQAVLGPLLADFVARHPAVTVALELDSRRVDLIGEEVDVAIRIGTLEDSRLVARRLATLGSRLCAGRPYAEARGIPRTPEELSGHILLSTIAAGRRWVLERDGETLELAIRPTITTNDPATMLAAIEAGAGLGWVPSLLAGREPRALVEVELDGWRLKPAEVSAIFPSRRALAPKVRAFIDFLQERLTPGTSA